jgi:hypothetical protein
MTGMTMNDIDRKRMGRLYSCMSKIPFPNRNRTLGVQDVSSFFYRFEELQPMFMRAIMAISRSDDPELSPDEELDNLERTISRMNKSLE